jgi:hypothetical protein
MLAFNLRLTSPAKTLAFSAATLELGILALIEKEAGSRYFFESLFWGSQPQQAAKT